MTNIQAYSYNLNTEKHDLELFVLIDDKWYSVASICEVYDEDESTLKQYCEQILKEMDYNIIKEGDTND